MKKLIAILVTGILAFTLTACSGVTGDSESSTPAGAGQTANTSVTATNTNSIVTADPETADYDDDDLEDEWEESAAKLIKLGNNTITATGEGVTVDGSRATINAAGVYVVSGTLDDGQIAVNTNDEEVVRLILKGAAITCSTSAPIYIMQAEKTIITLAEGTENSVTDGSSYILEDAESDEPNAAIFSKDDLTFNGQGSLSVQANYNNGIASKDELKIIDGNISVTAVNDGIKGRDDIAVKGGTITINAGGDGMQSNNDEDTEKGFVVIDGGTINITAGLDGIQAETDLAVNDGEITITTGGGASQATTTQNGGAPQGMQSDADNSDSGDSAKGLKANVDLVIEGGSITINSLDDALHSNGTMVVDGGDLNLTAGDDGIHADSQIAVNGGYITITKCYEGIESTVIVINSGNIDLVSNDDGFNATGGTGSTTSTQAGSGTTGGANSATSTAGNNAALKGPPGGNFAEGSSNNYLYIHGGYVSIKSNGDGLDANGPIEMTGGTVVINGPTNGGNGSLDYYTSFNMSGGYLVAAGSSGMAQSPSASSSQYSVMVTFSSAQTAGTLVHIESEDGEEILTMAPTTNYQTVVVCSPELENGKTYNVYLGGSSTGTATNGVYSGGTYSGGTQYISFTVSSSVTKAGAATGGQGGMGGGGGVPGGNRPQGVPGGVRTQ